MNEWIRKAQEGEKDAFSKLIRENYRTNLEYCKKISI